MNDFNVTQVVLYMVVMVMIYNEAEPIIKR